MRIKIVNLNKVYPGGKKALKDLNLEIEPGMFGLLGPNGAGKTSLMRIMTLLQSCTSGTIYFDDYDIAKDRKAIRSLLGYLPQDFRFFEKLKTWEFLDYGAGLAGIKGIQKEILEAAMVDGAGSFQRVRYIILPGLKNVFFTIVILSFLNSFKIYREAYLTAGAYPDRSIYLLQHLFNNWFVNLEFSKMAAASVLLFLVLLSGIWLLQGRWKEKEE